VLLPNTNKFSKIRKKCISLWLLRCCLSILMYICFKSMSQNLVVFNVLFPWNCYTDLYAIWEFSSGNSFFFACKEAGVQNYTQSTHSSWSPLILRNRTHSKIVACLSFSLFLHNLSWHDTEPDDSIIDLSNRCKWFRKKNEKVRKTQETN